jgi:hypothetical protein
MQLKKVDFERKLMMDRAYKYLLKTVLCFIKRLCKEFKVFGQVPFPHTCCFFNRFFQLI